MKKLILLVHGLGGSEETWGEFPKLIENDEAFKDFDFSIYEYPSSIVSIKDIVSPFSKLLSIFIPPSNLPSIQEIAEGLRSELRIRYAEYEEIYLVTHSMGGLVARKYLIDVLKDDVTTLPYVLRSSYFTPYRTIVQIGQSFHDFINISK